MSTLRARFWLPVGLVALAWAAIVAPLVGGGRTLYLRDVWNTHAMLRAYLVPALCRGELPLLDPLRAGGQGLAGNPNAVAFYPDNLLACVASPLWATNAHFWLHWLAAAAAAYALARALGLAREAAVGSGLVYALSGYFVSQLNLYNAVAGAALAPALVAAALVACRSDRAAPRPRWAAPALGGLWALLLVGGDPILAGLALVAAVAAVVTIEGRAGRLGRAGWAIAAGTLLAAPQWIESARLLPLSFRGHWGYGGQSDIERFGALAVADLVVPFFFGRPDLGAVWGDLATSGYVLYFTLFPGWIALALAGASLAVRKRATALGWGLVAAGGAIAIGGANPLVALASRTALGSVLRYPIKAWLLVAIGLAIAAGVALDELLRGRRRPVERALAAAAAAVVALWAIAGLASEPLLAWARGAIPDRFPDPFVAQEHLRWSGLLLFSAILLGLAALALRASRGGAAAQAGRARAELAVALLALLHGGSQLFFLKPALSSDASAPYREPPAALARLPSDAVLVHGGFGGSFGPSRIGRAGLPDPRTFWLERRAIAELHPFVGLAAGRRYELAYSPEGLDAFLTQLVATGLGQLSDRARLEVAGAFGVDRLLLDRELDPAALDLATEVDAWESFGDRLRVYALARPAREVELLTDLLPAPHVNAALDLLLSPAFDPRRTAIVAGDGAPRRLAADGTARLVSAAPERLVADVASTGGGVVLFRRAHLGLYRARIDGAPARPIVVQLARLGVEVPPGPHRVEVWIDRSSLAWGLALSGLGAIGLVGLGTRTGPHGVRGGRPRADTPVLASAAVSPDREPPRPTSR